MSRLDPTPDFARARLHVAAVGPGQTFGRIYLTRYPEPLDCSNAPSRFSDPRRRVVKNRFGVLYLGNTLKVCFLEAILRDERNGVIGDYVIRESRLRSRRYVLVESISQLNRWTCAETAVFGWASRAMFLAARTKRSLDDGRSPSTNILPKRTGSFIRRDSTTTRTWRSTTVPSPSFAPSALPS
jgi:hypothetical protein